MRTFESLSGWIDHDLIGHPVREILALAERHGRPHASSGMPFEVPVLFELPDLNRLADRPAEYVAACELEAVIRVLHCAIDYHWIPHRKIFVAIKPFDAAPEWATSERGVVIDPNWRLCPGKWCN